MKVRPLCCAADVPAVGALSLCAAARHNGAKLVDVANTHVAAASAIDADADDNNDDDVRAASGYGRAPVFGSTREAVPLFSREIHADVR